MAKIKINKELLILFAIILVALVLRLYKIDQYMTFLGDEGRDAIIVRRLLVEAHPPLIGPGTSIGQMYLGPLYYYMMAPALLLANFSPVGPAIQIAILGIITVAFVWWVGREWFGKTAGLTSAGLYAISPTVIIYSRSSWNPNIMPFFALLSIYSIWRVWKYKEFKWLMVLGIAFAFALQSHYLGLLLVPTIFLFWILTYLEIKKLNGNFLRKSVFGLLIFLGLMSPLLFFDIRHNWMNSQAIYKFFAVRQETVSIRPWSAIPKMPEILSQINTSLVAGKNTLMGQILSVGIAAVFVWLVWLFFKNKKKFSENNNLTILLFWIGFSLIGLGLYKQQIYDHYFGFVFAAIFLMMGFMVQKISEFKIARPPLVLAFIGLIYINLIVSPLRYSPNHQLERAMEVAEKIGVESGGEEFNLAVVAERNYQDGYKYFLLKENKKVIEIDAQRPETITKQLFVVCEMEPAKCNPTSNPRAEVANFGWSTIENQWTVDGVIIYKLGHSK